MKIIFLDIDGVLNSRRSAVANQDYGSIMYPDSWKSLDPIAIKLLQHICKVTQSGCVLSSSWRILAKNEDIIALQEYIGVNIIGMTPVARQPPYGRGHEIKQWLDNCKEPVEAYCIVDDDSDMLPEQQDCFVKTDERVGLAWQNCEDMMHILGHEEN